MSKSMVSEKASRAKIQSAQNNIAKAARVLIGIVRITERGENCRSSGAELSLEVELIGGGIETWKITIERTASSH